MNARIIFVVCNLYVTLLLTIKTRAAAVKKVSRILILQFYSLYIDILDILDITQYSLDSTPSL